MTASELAMVLASALLHAGWSGLIKGSGNPLAFNLVQEGFAVLAALLLLLAVDLSEIPRAMWVLTAVTGVAHALYLYTLSRAFERADMSVVYPIVRSTPALLPFLAVPLLGESISAAGAVGIAIVVAGVWGVQTGGDVRLRALLARGTGFAYLSLGTTVAYSLLDKQAMEIFSAAPWSSPVPRSVAFFFLLSAAHFVFFAPLALRHTPRAVLLETLRSAGPRALLALVTSLAGYGLILEAYRSAPASYVVAVRQTSVVFGLVLATRWLHERPGRARVIGALATVLGVAVIALSS